MARYIDADKLLNNLPDDLPYKASVKRVLIQAPTEDVVPKSEVDKWKQKAEELSEVLSDTIRIRYSEAKVEVARKIFQEIKNLLLPLVYLGADGKWHFVKPYGDKLHLFVEGFLDLMEKYTKSEDK